MINNKIWELRRELYFFSSVEIRIGKKETCNIKFIDVKRMASSLPSLTDDLVEGLDLLIFKCIKKIYEDLEKRLENTYQFCEGNINKICYCKKMFSK